MPQMILILAKATADALGQFSKTFWAVIYAVEVCL